MKLKIHQPTGIITTNTSPRQFPPEFYEKHISISYLALLLQLLFLAKLKNKLAMKLHCRSHCSSSDSFSNHND